MNWMNPPSYHSDDKENRHANSMQWHNMGMQKQSAFCGNNAPQRGGTFAENISRQQAMYVKHAAMELNFSVSYTDFEALPVVVDAQVEALLEHTRANFASGEWLRVFHAVTALRALHKAYLPKANAIFAAFDAYVLTALESPRPSLARNCLALVHEVLLHSRESALDVCIAAKLGEVLLRKLYVSDKQFGVIEPKKKEKANNMTLLIAKCVQTLLQHCLCDATLTRFCELSVSAPALSRLALLHVDAAVALLGDGVAQLQPDTLKTLFVALGHCASANGGDARPLALRLCRHFHALMRDNYQAYVMMLHSQQALTDDYTRALADAIQPDKPRPSTLSGNSPRVSKAKSGRRTTATPPLHLTQI